MCLLLFVCFADVVCGGGVGVAACVYYFWLNVLLFVFAAVVVWVCS